MVDFYNEFNKQQKVLLIIAIHTCITINGILHFSYLKNLSISKPYLRKVLFELSREKIIVGEFIKGQNRKFYFIPNSKNEEVASMLNFRIAWAYFSLEKIFQIYHNKMRSPSGRQDMAVKTERILHILTSEDNDILFGLGILYYVQKVNINRFYFANMEFDDKGINIFYPKYLIESFFGTHCNYLYDGIRVNLHKQFADYTVVVDAETKYFSANFIEKIKKRVSYIAHAFNLGFNERFSVEIVVDFTKKKEMKKKIHLIFNKSPMRTLKQNFFDYREPLRSINFGTARKENELNQPSAYDAYLQEKTINFLLCEGNFKITKLIPVNCDFFTYYEWRSHYSDCKEWLDFCERARLER